MIDKIEANLEKNGRVVSRGEGRSKIHERVIMAYSK